MKVCTPNTIFQIAVSEPSSFAVRSFVALRSFCFSYSVRVGAWSFLPGDKFSLASSMRETKSWIWGFRVPREAIARNRWNFIYDWPCRMLGEVEDIWRKMRAVAAFKCSRVGIKSPCRLSRSALPNSRQGILTPTLGFVQSCRIWRYVCAFHVSLQKSASPDDHKGKHLITFSNAIRLIRNKGSLAVQRMGIGLQP